MHNGLFASAVTGIRKTLKTVMKENGHEWLDVLKMDIGRSEVDVLNSMMDQHEVLPLSQLQLDIHAWGDMEKVEMFKDLSRCGSALRLATFAPSGPSWTCLQPGKQGPRCVRVQPHQHWWQQQDLAGAVGIAE
ncbi:hypothetical protein BGW39_006022 [Mortierella sp. 14UC]|nr:hypothetical protein BGW39_006022 [Mortierella sp. 14UC]